MAFEAYTFEPGVSPLVYLPTNGNRLSFTSTLLAGLTGGFTELDKCYGKYGLKWKWSTFESTASAINALSSTQVVYPSSWATVQCNLSAGSEIPSTPGTYPKKWTYEVPLSAELFNPSFLECSGSKIEWTLTAPNWSVQQTIPLSVSESYNFELRLLDYGLEAFTSNVYNDTIFTLNAQMSVGCLDVFSVPPSSFPTLVSETVSFTAVAPPRLKTYTPNRFVLTGVDVQFENLITNLNLVTALDIDFDDGKILYLSGDQVKNKYFTTNYDVIGFKTLKITAFANYGNEESFTVTFPNIIQVLPEYDIVSPTEYRIASDPLVLPQKETPSVGSNDWAIEDNINICFKQFYDNLEYLNSRSKIYNETYSEFFGYLGALPTTVGNVSADPIWTWEDADCLNTSLDYNVTWRKLLSADNPTDTGEFISYGTWGDQECKNNLLSQTCTERGSLSGTDCVQWSWRSRRSNIAKNLITWYQTKEGNEYSKRWRFELCPSEQFTNCNTGIWNVNIPRIDEFYPEFGNPFVQSRCLYFSIAARDNKIYLAQKTQIKLLSSDRDASFYSTRTSFDDVLDFSSIESIRLDSENKIFVLDSILSQVAVYKFELGGRGGDWRLFVNWGGVGNTNYKFSKPKDLHIDHLNNVWVADTGNNCIKHYSNTGTWLKSIKDEYFKTYPPLSLCVDSQKQLHVLTSQNIRVYSYNGDFIFSYNYSGYVSQNTPVKINCSYNREIIYLALDKQVLKFFRNGIFAGYIIKEKNNVYNITDIIHDEYRNLYITTNDKILKYSDLMTQTQFKGKLPNSYWQLSDLLIHKEEYIQNWVYTKSFQRLWDNIEMFRNSLFFTQTGCKSYKGPIHDKNKMNIGQNEIVTSTVINRVLSYLQDNFNTLLDYFDPNCAD